MIKTCIHNPLLCLSLAFLMLAGGGICKTNDVDISSFSKGSKSLVISNVISNFGNVVVNSEYTLKFDGKYPFSTSEPKPLYLEAYFESDEGTSTSAEVSGYIGITTSDGEEIQSIIHGLFENSGTTIIQNNAYVILTGDGQNNGILKLGYNGSMIVEGNFALESGSKLIITPGGYLRINGRLNISDDSSVYVMEDGALHIYGTLDLSKVKDLSRIKVPKSSLYGNILLPTIVSKKASDNFIISLDNDANVYRIPTFALYGNVINYEISMTECGIKSSSGNYISEQAIVAVDLVELSQNESINKKGNILRIADEFTVLPLTKDCEIHFDIYGNLSTVNFGDCFLFINGQIDNESLANPNIIASKNDYATNKAITVSINENKIIVNKTSDVESVSLSDIADITDQNSKGKTLNIPSDLIEPITLEHSVIYFNINRTSNKDLNFSGYTTIYGDITGSGDIYINGVTDIAGNINGAGDIYIYQPCVINGNISGIRNVYVESECILNGNISGSGCIYIEKNGTFKGPGKVFGMIVKNKGSALVL